MHFFLMYTDAQYVIFSANDNIAQALLLSSFTHTLESLGGEARGNFVKKENNNDIAFGDKTNTPAISRKADTDVRATSLVMHGGEREKQRSNHLQHFMLGGYTRRLSWLALRRRYQLEGTPLHVLFSLVRCWCQQQHLAFCPPPTMTGRRLPTLH